MDHPAKCPCLAKPIEEMHELVIPNSLASHIGDKTPWDEDTDIVSLGSPPSELVNHNEDSFSSQPYNGINSEDTYFAENGISVRGPPLKP